MVHVPVFHPVVTVSGLVHHSHHHHPHHLVLSSCVAASCVAVVVTIVESIASMPLAVVVLVVSSKGIHHLGHYHHFHHLHHFLVSMFVAILVSVVGHLDQVVGEPVEVSERGKVGLGGVHLEALGHGLLHVEGVELHVLLAPAALHGLGLGPLHEHLPVLASADADSGDNYQGKKKLHPVSSAQDLDVF